MQPTDTIRILILDDHDLFRYGLVRLLESEPDIEVAAHCATLEDAMQVVTQQRVDLVLLDYDLGAQCGSEFLGAARARGCQARILIVTAGMNDRQAVDMLHQGIAGIFLKSEPPQMLVQGIRQVTRGGACVNQRYLKALIEDVADPEPRQKALTARERAAMRGVLEGLSNKQLAERLEVSESSVKAALQQLFHKTGVRTRSQLVRVALERYRDVLTEARVASV